MKKSIRVIEDSGYYFIPSTKEEDDKAVTILVTAKQAETLVSGFGVPVSKKPVVVFLSTEHNCVFHCPKSQYDIENGKVLYEADNEHLAQKFCNWYKNHPTLLGKLTEEQFEKLGFYCTDENMALVYTMLGN